MENTTRKPSRIPRLQALKNTRYSDQPKQNENFQKKNSFQQNTKPSPDSSFNNPVTKASITPAPVIKSPLQSGLESLPSAFSRRTHFINHPTASNQIISARYRSVSDLNGAEFEIARQTTETSSGVCDQDYLPPIQQTVAQEKILTDQELKNLEATTDVILETALEEIKTHGVSKVFDMECFQPPSNLASLSSSCCSETNDVASDDEQFSLSNLVKQMDLEFMKIPCPSPCEKHSNDQSLSKQLESSVSEQRLLPSCVLKDVKTNHVGAVGSMHKLDSEPTNTIQIVVPQTEKSVGNSKLTLTNLNSQRNVSVIPLDKRASTAGNDKIECADRKPNKRSLTVATAPDNETSCGNTCASLSKHRIKLSPRKRKSVGGGVAETLRRQVGKDLEKRLVSCSTDHIVKHVTTEPAKPTPQTNLTMSSAHDVESSTSSQLSSKPGHVKTCCESGKPVFKRSTFVSARKENIDSVGLFSKLETPAVPNNPYELVKANYENDVKYIYVRLEKFENLQKW